MVEASCAPKAHPSPSSAAYAAGRCEPERAPRCAVGAPKWFSYCSSEGRQAGCRRGSWRAYGAGSLSSIWSIAKNSSDVISADGPCVADEPPIAQTLSGCSDADVPSDSLYSDGQSSDGQLLSVGVMARAAAACDEALLLGVGGGGDIDDEQPRPRRAAATFAAAAAALALAALASAAAALAAAWAAAAASSAAMASRRARSLAVGPRDDLDPPCPRAGTPAEALVTSLAAGGLACAALGASQVWLTDVDDAALALAERNAELNGLAQRTRIARLDLMTADGTPSADADTVPRRDRCVPEDIPFDCIVASDILYDVTAAEEAAATIARLLSRSPTARALICNSRDATRSAAAQRAVTSFASLCKDHPQLRCLKELVAGDERPAGITDDLLMHLLAPRPSAAPRRCAVFDFDDTLAVCVAEATDTAEDVFGGRGRIQRLASLFSELAHAGVSLAICSFNRRAVIEQLLV